LPFLPATELIITMRARAALAATDRHPIAARNALVDITGPITLTSICRRNSATGNSSNGPDTTMPALLTRPARVSPLSAETHLAGRGVDRGLVGDVEYQRHEVGAELLPQPIRVSLLAHTAETRESRARSALFAVPWPMAGRSAGDDDGLHGWLPTQFDVPDVVQTVAGMEPSAIRDRRISAWSFPDFASRHPDESGLRNLDQPARYGQLSRSTCPTRQLDRIGRSRFYLQLSRQKGAAQHVGTG